MTIHQLSVFVENKSGTLLQVLNLLKEANIQLIASTISDTVEYGIYRIICSEPQRALDTLKEAGISASPVCLTYSPLPWTTHRDVLPMQSSSSVPLESVFLTCIHSCWEEKESWYSGQTTPIKPAR